MTTSKSVNKISPSDGKSQIWTFSSAHHSLYTGLNNAIRIVIKHSHAGWQVADIQLNAFRILSRFIQTICGIA